MEYPCRACGAPLVVHQSIAVRGEPVDLYRCRACGLHEFPEPTWLDAAYRDPIAKIDVGLPARCIALAGITEAIVRAEGYGRRRHLDYGGGYGLLTRLVRDRGLDMHHHDPFADNLFAQGLDGAPDDDNAAVTLVEVFEHLTDPADVVAALRGAELLIISTVLVPPASADLSDWWYLIPDLGQHVTFYTEAALHELGRPHGYEVSSDGVNLHVLHRRPLSRLSRLVLRDQRSAPAIAMALRRRDGASSLAPQDAERAFGTARG